MVETQVSPSARSVALGDKDVFLRAFKIMLLSRTLEDKLASLYRSGKINGGCYIGRGQEALSVACGLSLRKGDTFAPLIRDQAGRLAFGEPLTDAFRSYLGSVHGPSRGRDGNVHRGRPREGILSMISHLGAMVSTCAGTLLARKLRGQSGTVGLVTIGDGGTSTGAFHEGLNLAAVEHLPLVVVVANNLYAYSTPNSRQFACKDLADRAAGYGVTGTTIAGNKLSECLNEIASAVDRARSGRGPQLVVATLLRLGGHGEHDDASYVDPALRSLPCAQDCIDVASHDALTHGWANREDLAAWKREAENSVNETLAKVQREPHPDPSTESWASLCTEAMLEGYFLS